MRFKPYKFSIVHFRYFMLLSYASSLAGCCGVGGGSEPYVGIMPYESTDELFAQDSALYVLDDGELKVFNIKKAKNTNFVMNFPAENAKSLFAYNGYLYVTGEDNIKFYDTKNPLALDYVGVSYNWNRCGSHLLKDGDNLTPMNTRHSCAGWSYSRDLFVMDFSDPFNPQELGHFWDMPGDIAKAPTPNYIIACPGQSGGYDGLKFLDIQDLSAIKEVAHFKEIRCEHVIVSGNTLIVDAPGQSVSQYSIDGAKLNLLRIL